MKNKLILLLLVFVPFFLRAQDYNYKNEKIDLKDLSEQSLFEIGSDDNQENFNFKLFFNDQSYSAIKSFLENLPLNSPNILVQKLVYKILTTQLNNENQVLSQNEDLELFKLKINKLFDSARFTEIDKIYSKTYKSINDENLNLKKIEGYFLRNEFKNACNLMDQEDFYKTYKFGKFEIICNIIERDFDKARFNLSLLKEKNEPGDSLFIDLCYGIIGDLKISKSKIVSENTDEISALNPILLSSLQLAEISPKFQHIKKAPTSVLTFILSSPSSSINIKLYTSELLVKQKRIKNSILADIYQLNIFDDQEIENSVKEYKKLSPTIARSLLYQAFVLETNIEKKFLIAKILLKQSYSDGLFTNISFLLNDSLDYENLTDISNEDKEIIFKMLISVNEFEKAENFMANDTIFFDEKFKLLLNLNRFIEDKSYFDEEIIKDYINKVVSEKNYTTENKRIILITSLLFNLENNVKNNLTSQIVDKKQENINIFDFFFAINFSEKNDYFNTIKILFRIFENKDINQLSELETILIVKLLYDLSLDEEFKIISRDLLLNL